ncbi:MAG TPA: dynamin family protein [Azospirillaceae bacterium]|nr:dynamin family protein [Azospirillaceae bacterium]
MARTAARRVQNLRTHLKAENPDLVGLVDAYVRMDKLLRRMRLLDRDDTLTTRIGWWPVVAAVGLYSAGKSTFLNDLLGQTVQRTGNQAVDDKFTVICHGTELRELPGTALDVDPRFPFHAMGDEIDKVAPGEGKMVDRYLALKTVPSDRLRGMILVDSPGFDSDEYRHATLRLIDHILDLSDLVLVMFDARKPEPGVMRDTLDKLVARVKDRADVNKFLFILNQIDATGREDNLEEVVGAWQRALAGVGITGGRFYAVYSERAAEGTEVQPRLREIRARDMDEIGRRISEVSSVRGYRVANGIEAVAKEVREEAVPRLTAHLARWRKSTNRLTLGVALAALVLAVAGAGLALGDPLAALALPEPWPWVILGAFVLVVLVARFWGGRAIAKRMARDLPEKLGGFQLSVRRAFLAATEFPLLGLRRRPLGWSRGTEKRIQAIREAIAGEVRRLNDRWARPGSAGAPPAPGPAREVDAA